MTPIFLKGLIQVLICDKINVVASGLHIQLCLQH